MSLRINAEAPNFTANTTQGTIDFHSWIGDSWTILFSHPKDFTPVCTTELGYMAGLKPEFDKRNTKIIGLSVDPVENHSKWAQDIEETQGHAVNYPMIGDTELKVAMAYDMLPEGAGTTSDGRTAADNATVRSVFVIGPDKKIKAMLTYPMTTGRNFDEVLRLLDSCQLTAKHTVATPVNWQPGEDVIIPPAVSNEQAAAKYPNGWKTLKPYLRVVAQPATDTSVMRSVWLTGHHPVNQTDNASLEIVMDQALDHRQRARERNPRPTFSSHRGRQAMIFRQLFEPISCTYSYLIASRRGGEALIIDPVLEKVDRYLQLMRELDLHLVKAVDTHLHADHITGLGALRDRTRCITVMGEQSSVDVVSMRIADGDTLRIEGVSMEAMYTPGHTDDSYSFLMQDRVFTGDTLMIRGTGRTDFQNGDPRTQYESLFGRLLRLPDETLVFPAHDYKGDTVSTSLKRRLTIRGCRSNRPKNMSR